MNDLRQGCPHFFVCALLDLLGLPWFKESKNTGLKPSSCWSRSSRTIVFPHTLSWLRRVLWYCDGPARVSASTRELQRTKETQSAQEGKTPLGLRLYWEKCGKICAKDFRFQPETVLLQGSCDDEGMLDYITSAGTRLHQRAHCGGVWRMWPFSSSSSSSADRQSPALHHVFGPREHQWTVHIQTVVSSMKSHCCTRPVTSLCSVHVLRPCVLKGLKRI